MQDRKKATDQKSTEIARLRQRIAELEASEADHERMEEVLQRAYDEVKEREKLHRTLVDNMDLGVSLIDADHTIVMANAAEGKQFNRPISAHFIGEKCFRAYEKRETVCPHCPGVQAMATGQPAEVETEGIRTDGSRYYVRLQAFPVFGDDGRVTGFIEISENIIERKQAEETLRTYREHLEELAAERTVQLKRINEQLEAEVAERKQAEKETAEAKAYLESSLASIPDGVLLLDNQARFSYVNPIFLEWLGREAKDFIGKNVQDVSPPFMNPEVTNIIADRTKRRVKTGEPIAGVEVEIIGKEGNPIHISYSAAGIKDQKGNILGEVVFLKDITALHNLVLIDELTGLYNRRGFFTLAQQQLKLADRTKREMVLLLVDVDHLKWINDTLGHHEGDLALIETAEVLKETLRSSDVIARIGGDEFVVLAIEAHKDSIESITARLQKNLDARNARVKKTSPYTLSLSIGTVFYESEYPCSIDDLLRRADQVMYEQKRSKENINSGDKTRRAVRC